MDASAAGERDVKMKKAMEAAARLAMEPEIISALAARTVSALKLAFTKGSEEVAKSAFKDAYQAIKARLSQLATCLMHANYRWKIRSRM